jgi:opacity protein-like surface antigen
MIARSANRGALAAALFALGLLAGPHGARAQAAEPDSVTSARVDGLEALVPDAARAPFALQPGVRPFQERREVSPGYGVMGTDKLFVLRAAYHPSRWLGYEATLGHNPGHSVHAVMHTFGLIARWPVAGRFQPYATGGYGMVMVQPGPSLNAKPVTKNALSGGAGMEWFIRDDLALRGEWREAAVFGEQRGRDGIVVYDYTQATLGLAFYRSIRP